MNAENRKQERSPIVRAIGVGLATVFLAAGLPGISVGQDPLATLDAVSPFFGGGTIVGGGYPFKASTPAESFARGAADVIRARGQFNLLTSAAAINATEARARSIVNAQEGVKAYFNIRQLNRDYRQAERRPRPTKEDYERYARAARPAPLSPSELDTITGRVNWPILLQDDRFASMRAELEELLDRWAVSRNLGHRDSFGAEQHLAVRRTADQLTEELREEVRNLPPQDYIAAKRFLRSLEYQVLQPSTSSVSLASLR